MKKSNSKQLIGLMFLIILLTACTKERPFDVLFKDRESHEAPNTKTLISLEEEYLYVPSAVNNTRTTDATFPGYMGEAKIVRLKFTENSLQVLEVDPEKRFGDNVVNNKPVLEIPITHVDYKCSEDADGKCTNKEEENNDISWAKKGYFKIQAAAMAVQEVNYLPIEITNLFYPCYNEVGSNVVDVKIEADAINIQVEKHYKARLECAEIKSLSDLSFRVRNHYSLAKMNKISSSDYVSLSYPRKEENLFGFFTTNTLKLDVDNTETIGSQSVFANRWKPNRKVIYHLTSNFDKPENEKIKLLTLEAIESINRTLKRSGADLEISVGEKTVTDTQIGDLRITSIVLVEDPIAFPLLGYGPSAANPRTGEIVQARTSMYLGVLKQVVKNSYEDYVIEKMNQAKSAIGESQTETDGTGDIVTVGPDKGKLSLDEKLVRYVDSRARPNIQSYLEAKEKISAMSRSLPSSNSSSKTLAQNHSHNQSPSNKPELNEKLLKQHAQGLNKRKIQLHHLARMDEDESIRETIMSMHCYYTTEMGEISKSLEEEIEKIITEVGLKPWDQLAESEQEKVMNALLPAIYLSTLVHEIGHNLGLRHNFAGSEDKENFYTEKELAEMGIKKPIPYSSVMEYSYKQTNELPVMGKYDIAALQYGYAEKIELNDGRIVDVQTFRKEPAEPRAYQYCTDEHVSVNPNCNRFDEGTNLVEITKHLMNAYNKNYYRRNFRNNRLSFSVYDDLSHARRIKGTMMGLRSMLERYESIKETFGLADSNPVWDQIDFLKELKQSSRMAGKFLVSVLNTPDTMCAISAVSNPNRILGLLPIRAVSSNAISCFDKENMRLNPQYISVGEAGKSFQSRKDPRMRNPYIDQIDVRGIWIDKLLAAQALVGRVTGIEIYDEFTGNFLDLEDMREEIQQALTTLALDEVVTKVPIATITGQVLLAEVGVTMFEPMEGQHPHRIPKHIFNFVRRAFGLPNGNSDFQSELVRILGKELPSRNQLADEKSLWNSTRVLTNIPPGQDTRNYISAKIGLNVFFVNKESEVAATHIVSREIVSLLTGLGEEKVVEIIDNLSAGNKAPDGATDAEKLAYDLSIEVLIRFVQGGFKDPIFYEHMLMSLVQN